MDEPCMLGLDVGTTTCRAIVVAESGRTVASATLEVASRFPEPVAAEIAPEDWWRCVIAVTRTALDRGRVEPGRIAGIGLSGLMHAPVLLDDAGNVIADAPLWMDQRCRSQSQRLMELAKEVGAEWADVRTSVTACKLRWWAEMAPEVLNGARTVLLPKDFIRFRLTGVVATDHSDALGTGLMDPSCGEWHEGLARNAGVSPTILPPIRSSHEQGGRVTRAAAAATGLRAGTPVAIGGSDALCTRVGIGPLDAGSVLAYLGTAAWIAVSDGVDGSGYPIAHDRGATTATGAALRWMRDLVCARADAGDSWTYGDLVALAEAVTPGSDGLVFLPHLMGERGPVHDPSARGAWIGLTLHHRTDHLVRSVLEGTAFQLRRLLERNLPDHEGATAHCCGGVCRSPGWMQIIADVTGLTLRWPENVEAAALGAAVLGGKACGLIRADAAVEWNHAGGTVRPRSGLRSAYDAAYEAYCSLDNRLV